MVSGKASVSSLTYENTQECTGEEYRVRTSGSLNKETQHVLVNLGSGSTKTSKGHNNGWRSNGQQHHHHHHHYKHAYSPFHQDQDFKMFIFSFLLVQVQILITGGYLGERERERGHRRKQETQWLLHTNPTITLICVIVITVDRVNLDSWCKTASQSAAHFLSIMLRLWSH